MLLFTIYLKARRIVDTLCLVWFSNNLPPSWKSSSQIGRGLLKGVAQLALKMAWGFSTSQRMAAIVLTIIGGIGYLDILCVRCFCLWWWEQKSEFLASRQKSPKCLPGGGDGVDYMSSKFDCIIYKSYIFLYMCFSISPYVRLHVPAYLGTRGPIEHFFFVAKFFCVIYHR